jgi:aspartate aminotransferase-like enzyme
MFSYKFDGQICSSVPNPRSVLLFIPGQFSRRMSRIAQYYADRLLRFDQAADIFLRHKKRGHLAVP